MILTTSKTLCDKTGCNKDIDDRCSKCFNSFCLEHFIDIEHGCTNQVTQKERYSQSSLLLRPEGIDRFLTPLELRLIREKSMGKAQGSYFMGFESFWSYCKSTE